MPKKTDWDQERIEWVEALRVLCDEIKGWAEARHWFVHEDEKLLSEERLGRYAAPTLFIQSPQGRIQVDPIGRDILGADGRVDILSFPSLNCMLLLRVGGLWLLKTESGIDWPEPWNADTFFKLANALACAT